MICEGKVNQKMYKLIHRHFKLETLRVYDHDRKKNINFQITEKNLQLKLNLGS